MVKIKKMFRLVAGDTTSDYFDTRIISLFYLVNVFMKFLFSAFFSSNIQHKGKVSLYQELCNGLDLSTLSPRELESEVLCLPKLEFVGSQHSFGSSARWTDMVRSMLIIMDS